MTSLSKNILKNAGNDSLDFSEVPLKVFVFPTKKEETKCVLDKTTEEVEDLQSTEAQEEISKQEEVIGKDTETQDSAEQILEEAKQQAEKLLLEAEIEAEDIRKQAEKDGYIAGWEHGCQEGKIKAIEEANLQKQEQQQEFHRALSDALESIDREKDVCLKRYLEELKNLAVAVGEKVIRISLKSNGGVIRRMIESETEKMKKKAWVHIYMEQEDYETMLQADSDAVSHLANLSDNVKFVVMEQTTGGSCIIETPDEIIDMSVDTQIENIRKLVGDVRF